MKLTKTGKKKSAKPKEKQSLKEDTPKKEERKTVDFVEVMRKILSVNPKKLAVFLFGIIWQI